MESAYHIIHLVYLQELPPENTEIITRLLHPILTDQKDLAMEVIHQTTQRVLRAAETGIVFALVENTGPQSVLGIATLVNIHTIASGHTGMIEDFAVDPNRDQLELAEALMRPLIECAKKIGMRWIIAEPCVLYQHQTYDNFGFTAEGHDRRMQLMLEG